jgi:predicted transcriptional regulator
LKPETVLPFSDADAFLASKVEWALTAQNAFQKRAALDLISAFVNKHAASLSSLPSLLETIWATVTDASQPAAKRQAALQVYFHVS